MALENSKTMFDDCSNEKSPNNLGDCLKQDKVTANLWSWAHNLEVIGQVLLAIILIAGVFETIVTAMATGEANVSEGASMFTAVVVLVKWALYAIIEYCVYHVLALLVGSLASIVYHTKVTAQIAELQYRNEIPAETKNANVHTAPAGNNSIFNTNNSTVSDDGTWLCGSCGCRNQKSTKYCKNCGKSK